MILLMELVGMYIVIYSTALLYMIISRKHGVSYFVLLCVSVEVEEIARKEDTG